ncbi:MAG: tripartite tricarboxylate transporter substrate binding protein [Betaproteobacteria bacterium]|nr:tripartite tricarboxylate transporter substrate binding protein [Betaproteobacteria bacterium]MBI2961468.1 tripartite tricarboxylate transporter substrate binding protein [Betaproteobacteria bacterium]
MYASIGRLGFFAALLAGALVPATASAQAWPTRPVKLVVGFAAGGNTDAIGRIAADRLGAAFGQPFLIENRVGASGAIAAEFVAKSPPDGYTFFVGATPNILVVPRVNKVNYDGQKDFIPVAILTTNPFVLATHPSIPVRTLREFVDYVKTRPGKLNFGSGGSGTVAHLSGALLLSRAGINVAHIPYKGGAPAVADLVGGQIQMYFGNASELIPHIRAGKVTVLGVSSEKRARELPDVPSIAETYPGFHTYTWNGLLAPVGTPRAILERVAQEVARMVADPAVAERFHKIGTDPSGIALEKFAELIRKEQPMWVEAIKAAGIGPRAE